MLHKRSTRDYWQGPKDAFGFVLECSNYKEMPYNSRHVHEHRPSFDVIGGGLR